MSRPKARNAGAVISLLSKITGYCGSAARLCGRARPFPEVSTFFPERQIAGLRTSNHPRRSRSEPLLIQLIVSHIFCCSQGVRSKAMLVLAPKGQNSLAQGVSPGSKAVRANARPGGAAECCERTDRNACGFLFRGDTEPASCRVPFGRNEEKRGNSPRLRALAFAPAGLAGLRCTRSQG